MVPTAKATGTAGKSGDFEVTAGGTLIFSKQEIGAFPKIDAVSLRHADVHAYLISLGGGGMFSRSILPW